MFVLLELYELQRRNEFSCAPILRCHQCVHWHQPATSFLTDTKRITPDGFRLFSFAATALQVNKSLQTANLSKQSSTPRADKVYSEEKHNEERPNGCGIIRCIDGASGVIASLRSRRDSHRPMAGAT
jgi:hypothetical protein